LSSKGAKTTEVYGIVGVQNGNNRMIQKIVYEWIIRIKGGLINDVDDMRLGRQ
jgi:hypothetical protein